jgi:hypothetical protein
MILNFEKESTGWYIVLPEWNGSKADLAMVCGADTLLDQLSQFRDKVSLEVHLEQLDESFIKLKKKNDCWFNGANYIVQSTNHELWLCNVTKFVFGNLPDVIYFKVNRE